MVGDYIGFTNEGDVGPISYTDDRQGRTRYVMHREGSMPRVGNQFQFFDELQYSFSIAVQVTGQFSGLFKTNKTRLLSGFCFFKRLTFCLNLRQPSCIPMYHNRKRSKSKAVYSCLWKSISQLRSVTCHMGSHSVTCHPTQVSTPHLNPRPLN